MFVPPEDRQPLPPPPSHAPPPKPGLTKREEAAMLWAIGFLVVSIVLAPIGGSTLLEALWYVIRQ